MKKSIKMLSLILILLVLLSSCNISTGNFKPNKNDSNANQDYNKDSFSSTNNSENSKKLEVNISREMIQNNLIDYKDPKIQSLSKFLQENNDLGSENDFSFYFINLYKKSSKEGKVDIFFIAINRFSFPIKDVSFKMTLVGNNINVKDLTIRMSESDFGSLPANSATPVMITIDYNEPIENLLDDMETAEMAVKDFEYTVDKS